MDIRIKGKRIRRSLHTTNRYHALDKYKEVKDNLINERLGKKIKFSDFCKQYLDWAWSSKPLSALREKQRLIKIQEFFNLLNIVYLSDIKPYHIEKLKSHLESQHLMKTTINRYLQLLKTLFYRAIDWEVYDGINPVKKVKFYREEYHIESLSHAHVQKILLAAKELSDRSRSPALKSFPSILAIAVNTGMRKSEILKLRWNQIKSDRIEVLGKGGRKRSVPINETVNSILIQQPRKEQYVFDIPHRDNPKSFQRTISKIKKSTGIRWHFHLLRHYFTTSLLEKGVDLVTIGSILGHTRITMSLLYSHTDERKKKKAVDLLADTSEDT